MFAERPAVGVIRIYHESLFPEFLKWMRILLRTSVPHVLVHSSGPGRYSENRALRNRPLPKLEVPTSYFSAQNAEHPQSQDFCENGLEKWVAPNFDGF